MTYKQWINNATIQLNAYCHNNKNLAESYATIIIEHIIQKKILPFQFDTVIHDEIVLKKLDTMLEQVILYNKPLAYEVGLIQFCSSEISVEPPILIPRVETEYWVYEIVSKIQSKEKNYMIADFCCGSGCIGIAVLQYLKNAQCHFYDIEKKACDLTQKNCIKNNIFHDRYTIYNKDIQQLKYDENQLAYDFIFCNPPYISLYDYNQLDDSVKLWEDKKALTDGIDGTSLVVFLIDNAHKIINKNGYVAIEIDSQKDQYFYDYAQSKNYYSSVIIIFDQYEKSRVLICQK